MNSINFFLPLKFFGGIQFSGIAISTALLVKLPKCEAYTHKDSVVMDAQTLQPEALVCKAVNH